MRKSILLCGLSLFVFGCGGDSSSGNLVSNQGGVTGNSTPNSNGSNNNPGSNTPGSVTFSARKATLDRIAGFRDGLNLDDPVADRNALIAFLNSLAQFVEVGFVDLDVWARFSDGRTVCIPLSYNSTFPEQPPLPRVATSETPIRALADSSPDQRGDANPPRNSVVEFMVDLGSFPSGDAQAMSRRFSQAGYNSLVEDFNLDHLSDLSNTGVLYVDCHGGVMVMRDGSTKIGLITHDDIGETIETRYLEMLNDDSLAYLIQPPVLDLRDGVRVVTQKALTRYAVTGNFFRSHANASFRQNSLVFINGCKTDGHDGTIRDAFFSVGASNFIGWSKKVLDADAPVSARFLIDRLLGEGSEPFLPETPLQRPFPLGAVFANMASRSRSGAVTHLTESAVFWNTFVEPLTDGIIARLTNSPNPAQAHHMAFLAPSIQRLEVESELSGPKLRLFGLFPAIQLDGDTVTLGDTALTVESWSPSQIVCLLPPSGGGLVKMSSDGISSNEVPLTEWEVTATIQQQLDATYTFQPPSTVQKTTTDVGATIITGKLKFRTDLHGYRTEPAGSLQFSNSAGNEGGTSILNRTGTRVTDNQYRPTGSLVYTYTPNANTTGIGSLGLSAVGQDLSSLDIRGFLTFRITNGFDIHPAEVPSRTPPLPDFIGDMEASFGPFNLKISPEYNLTLENQPQTSFTPLPESGRPGEGVTGGVTRLIYDFVATLKGGKPDANTLH